MIIISLTPREIDYVKKFAKNSCIGGVSQIYGNRTPEMVADNQYTMHVGEASLSKYLTGDIGLYIKTRTEKDKTPHVGDGGSDLIGLEIDIKTSRMRAKNPDHLYSLYVRDKEYHPDTTYVLALMPTYLNNVCILVGWIVGKYLPESKDGRRSLIQSELNPMESLYDPNPFSGDEGMLAWIEHANMAAEEYGRKVLVNEMKWMDNGQRRTD